MEGDWESTLFNPSIRFVRGGNVRRNLRHEIHLQKEYRYKYHEYTINNQNIHFGILI
jgi:hypothetical protein